MERWAGSIVHELQTLGYQAYGGIVLVRILRRRLLCTYYTVRARAAGHGRPKVGVTRC